MSVPYLDSLCVLGPLCQPRHGGARNADLYGRNVDRPDGSAVGLEPSGRLQRRRASGFNVWLLLSILIQTDMYVKVL